MVRAQATGGTVTATIRIVALLRVQCNLANSARMSWLHKGRDSDILMFKFSEGGSLQQSRVGYQLNAAVRAAGLDARELLRSLLPPLIFKFHVSMSV